MPATATPRTFTGRHMLMVMIGFFGVVIGVNMLLATLAADTWTGLVVENAYVASQEFNEDLARARQQQALGWHSTLSYAGGALHLSIVAHNGKPLPGLSVTAILQRPTHEGEDRKLALEPSPAGGYAAAVSLPRGTWNAEVEASDAQGRSYHRTFRLWVGDK